MSLKFRGCRGDGDKRGKGIGGLLRKNKETNNDNIETYTKVSKVKKGKRRTLKRLMDIYGVKRKTRN